MAKWKSEQRYFFFPLFNNKGYLVPVERRDELNLWWNSDDDIAPDYVIVTDVNELTFAAPSPLHNAALARLAQR